MPLTLDRVTVWVEHGSIPELIETNHYISSSNPDWMQGAPLFLQNGQCWSEVGEIDPIPEWFLDKMSRYTDEALATVGYAPQGTKRTTGGLTKWDTLSPIGGPQESMEPSDAI